MKKSILLLLIMVATATFAQESKIETPKIAVKVAMGETVKMKNVAIKFVDVLEDSRCPKFTDCIWAGRVKALVEVTANGTTEQQTLIFGAVKPGEEANTNLYNTADFSINAIEVNPEATIETNADDREYVLLICEEKNK